MSAVDVCVQELRAGLAPGEIASKQGLPLVQVLDFLDRAVGQNKISRSEIYFSIPAGSRERVDDVRQSLHVGSGNEFSLALAEAFLTAIPGLSNDSLQVCLRYGPANKYYGDLYELVRTFEIYLHSFIRDVLVGEFGDERRAWWYKGVPVRVRKGCAERAEELSRWDLDPWSCTFMLDLQTVLKENWSLFNDLYKVGDRNSILNEFGKINSVRNRVMHPVRDSPPTNADFDTLRDAHLILNAARARFYVKG